MDTFPATDFNVTTLLRLTGAIRERSSRRPDTVDITVHHRGTWLARAGRKECRTEPKRSDPGEALLGLLAMLSIRGERN